MIELSDELELCFALLSCSRGGERERREEGRGFQLNVMNVMCVCVVENDGFFSFAFLSNRFGIC